MAVTMIDERAAPPPAGAPSRPGAALARPHARDWLICGALMAGAALFRLLLLAHIFTNVDSDQAVIGVMAFHIQAGQHPLMYAGQPYQGSIEAYAAALLFTLFGASDWTLRLPMLACSVLFVGAIFTLGARLYGRPTALLSALFVAFGPGMLAYYGDVTGFGYIEVTLLGTILLIVQTYYPDLRKMPFPIALGMGLLAGLGVWIEPLMVEYLAALGIAYMLSLLSTRRARSATRRIQGHIGGPNWDRDRDGATRPRSRSSPSAGAGAWLRLIVVLGTTVAGFVAGAAPLLAYNIQHGWATATYLFPHMAHDDHMLTAMRTVVESLPIVLGLASPVPDHAVFARLAARHALEYGAGVAAGGYLLVRLIMAPGYLLVRLIMAPGYLLQRIAALAPAVRRQWPRPVYGEDQLHSQDQGHDHYHDYGHDVPRDGALALFGACCLAFFICSHFGSETTSTARYLLPIYTLTPLVVHHLLPRRPRRGAEIRATLLTAGLLIAALSITGAIPLVHAPRRPIGGLIATLEAQGARVAYTNYWIAYAISFESHGRVLGIPIDSLHLARIRVPSDLEVAARTPARELAWVFSAGSRDEQSFRLLLKHADTQASAVRWANLVIYDHLSRPLHPPGPYQYEHTTWFEKMPPISMT